MPTPDQKGRRGGPEVLAGAPQPFPEIVMGDAMDVDMEAVDDRRWDARAYDDDDDVLDAAPMDVDEDLVRCALASISALRRAPTACGDDLLNAHEMTLALSSSDEGGVMSTGMLPPPSSLLAPRDGADRAVLTLVPDTNALVRRGGASLRELLERFRPTPRVSVLITIPRKVVQELDRLKSRGDEDGIGRGSEVARLARGVNRAVARRLEEQREALQSAPQSAPTPQLASLAVQGPGDAGKMRLAMRAEGGAAYASGDEEIVFFAQARVRRGEIVALFTADVNAAVTARSHASEDDVPVATFDPNDAPVDADALFAATSRFYDAAATERGAMERGAVATRVLDATASHVATAPLDATAPHVATAPLDASDSRAIVVPSTTTAGSVVRVEDASSPSNSARSVLTALDDALSPAVTRMLRDALGDMWASGVRDDAENIDHLGADEAFDALRRNYLTLVDGRRGREGQRAMGTLRDARRAAKSGRGAESATREGAMRVVAAAREVLSAFPGDIREVIRARETSAAAEAALARDVRR